MKRGIEHSNLRDVWQMDLAGADSPEIVRVVEGRDVDIISDPFDYILVDQDGGAERFASMNDPVADSADLSLFGQDSVVLAEEHCQNVFNGSRVLENFARNFYFISVGAAVGQHRPAHTDAVDDAFSQRLTGIDLDELVFDRRTAAIEDENIH